MWQKCQKPTFRSLQPSPTLQARWPPTLTVVVPATDYRTLRQRSYKGSLGHTGRPSEAAAVQVIDRQRRPLSLWRWTLFDADVWTASHRRQD